MENSMLKKTLTIAVIALSLISGCSSLSNEQKANINRDDAVNSIITEIDEVGYEVVSVSPGIDEFINGLSAYVVQQRNVAVEYRTIADNYKDVTGFLADAKGKTDEEIWAEAEAFDLGAKTDDETIGKKLIAYRKAKQTISEENAKLTGELLKQGATLALFVTQYGTEIAKITAVNAAMGFFKGDKEDEKLTIPTAIIRAKEQLTLLNKINALIEADQAIAGDLTKLQEQLDARS